MKGALVILVFTILMGILIYIGEVRYRRRHPQQEEASLPEENSDTDESSEESSECCGLHLVCEKDSLSPTTDAPVYFDDEELDRFRGRSGNDYTAEEIEEFRDVLMTLRPEDVAPWARSITQRALELPPDVKDELLMLVNEVRSRSASGKTVHK